MTDLLVSSLMAEGGLETALQHAIRLESSSCSTDCNDGAHLPLLQLITRLLGNNASLTQSRLSLTLLVKQQQHQYQHQQQQPAEEDHLHHHHHQQYQHHLYHQHQHQHHHHQHQQQQQQFLLQQQQQPGTSPSLCLLHRFQRLLLAYIHQAGSQYDTTGAEALLAQYLHSLIPACVSTLQQAQELALQCRESGELVTLGAQLLGAALNRVLQSDISDALLHELLVGLVLLKRDRPHCLAGLRWARLFLPLLRVLDRLNRALGEGELRDNDDMGWPGIICRGGPKGGAPPPAADPETHYVRRCDMENLLLDGGRCIIVAGYVCDLNGYK